MGCFYLTAITSDLDRRGQYPRMPSNRWPAKERREIDWDTANRLITQNKDFRDYIKLVREFYQTGDPRVNDWDAKVEQD